MNVGNERCHAKKIGVLLACSLYLPHGQWNQPAAGHLFFE